MTKTSFRFSTVLLIAVSAAACTSTPRGTEVTRFHLDKPIPEQSVGVRDNNEKSIEIGAYEDIVQAELARIGYPVVDEATTELFVDIDFFRGMQSKAPSRSPVSVGIGGSSYGGNIGIGGGVTMPVGGGPAEVYVTRLEIKFVNRAENAIIWEGRAKQESKTAPADPEATMRRIAAALLQNFPGESGKTVVVADPPAN
jgi:hypothetical protein